MVGAVVLPAQADVVVEGAARGDDPVAGTAADDLLDGVPPAQQQVLAGYGGGTGEFVEAVEEDQHPALGQQVGERRQPGVRPVQIGVEPGERGLAGQMVLERGEDRHGAVAPAQGTQPVLGLRVLEQGRLAAARRAEQHGHLGGVGVEHVGQAVEGLGGGGAEPGAVLALRGDGHPRQRGVELGGPLHAPVGVAVRLVSGDRARVLAREGVQLSRGEAGLPRRGQCLDRLGDDQWVAAALGLGVVRALAAGHAHRAGALDEQIVPGVGVPQQPAEIGLLVFAPPPARIADDALLQGRGGDAVPQRHRHQRVSVHDDEQRHQAVAQAAAGEEQGDVQAGRPAVALEDGGRRAHAVLDVGDPERLRRPAHPVPGQLLVQRAHQRQDMVRRAGVGAGAQIAEEMPGVGADQGGERGVGRPEPEQVPHGAA